jgi:hypothetical protein
VFTDVLLCVCYGQLTETESEHDEEAVPGGPLASSEQYMKSLVISVKNVRILKTLNMQLNESGGL